MSLFKSKSKLQLLTLFSADSREGGLCENINTMAGGGCPLVFRVPCGIIRILHPETTKYGGDCNLSGKIRAIKRGWMSTKILQI